MLLSMCWQCKKHLNAQSRSIMTSDSLSCHFFVTALSSIERSEREVQQKSSEMFRGVKHRTEEAEGRKKAGGQI